MIKEQLLSLGATYHDLLYQTTRAVAENPHRQNTALIASVGTYLGMKLFQSRDRHLILTKLTGISPPIKG